MAGKVFGTGHRKMYVADCVEVSTRKLHPLPIPPHGFWILMILQGIAGTMLCKGDYGLDKVTRLK